MEQPSPLLTGELKFDCRTQPSFTHRKATFLSFNEQIPVRLFRQDHGVAELPVVLVLHDKQGDSIEIEMFCQHLAHAGYLAIAPDLFSRQFAASSSALRALSDEQLSKIKDRQVMADLDRCANWALSQGGRARSLSIIGFGWGGRMSWLYCAHTPQLKAAISCDPILSNTLTLTQPNRPIDQVAKLQAPLLVLTSYEQSEFCNGADNRLQQAIQANVLLEHQQMHATGQRLLKTLQSELAEEVPPTIVVKMMEFLAKYNPITNQ